MSYGYPSIVSLTQIYSYSLKFVYVMLNYCNYYLIKVPVHIKESGNKEFIEYVGHKDH